MYTYTQVSVDNKCFTFQNFDTKITDLKVKVSCEKHRGVEGEVKESRGVGGWECLVQIARVFNM